MVPAMAVEHPVTDLSLRERKRLALMRRIQDVALELFTQRGFEDVTIEEVAAAAEVSPSSVYRYFGTKEHLVIWDRHDVTTLAALGEGLVDQPPLEAIRAVVVTAIGEALEAEEPRLRARLQLVFTNPSIEAALALQAYERSGPIAHVLGASLDRSTEDLDLQVLAYAFAGGLLGALRHWYLTDFRTPVSELVERPFAILERSLGAL